jgi:hypothetical protein
MDGRILTAAVDPAIPVGARIKTKADAEASFKETTMKPTPAVPASAATFGLANIVEPTARRAHKLGILFVALLALSRIAGAQSWLAAPKASRSFSPGTTALQLTDGTIMVQERGTSNWWKLTPDNHADYNTGKWSQLASSQWTDSAGNLVDYAPEFCASAVLPDGRVIVMGGEYNWVGGKEEKNDTTLGAIFDPTVGTNGSWTPVAPPKGWKTIGDAASIVLSDGTFMLSNCCDFPSQAALLDAKTLTWKILTPKSGYKSKFDSNNEEGWIPLPDGTVLTVDAYIHPREIGSSKTPTLANNSEIYTPSTGTWASAGNTVQPLSWLPAICGINGGHEVGPAILRPDATVFATGVNTCGGAGHTAIYHFGGAFWTAGPDIPCEGSGSAKICNDMADAPPSATPALIHVGTVSRTSVANKAELRLHRSQHALNRCQ